MAMVLVIAGLTLSACTQVSTASGSKIQAATVESIEGTSLHRVTLTAKAAKRLDIQTVPVRDAEIGGTQRKVIPYAAVIYRADGSTWTYTSPQPLVFIRRPIMIDRIEGDMAILWDGPPSGTEVVTVGAAELFGTESGVGGEH
ncbi:MAG: hypothetical protein ACRDZ4_08610 [Egibacteraceae bacterium]